jgi:hypothetical protein
MANNNPFQSGVDKKKKSDTTINKNKQKSKSETAKANSQRTIQVLKTPQPPTKKISIVLSSLLTTAILKVLAEQKGRLQDLVIKTNNVIDNATTKDQIQQAIILKNSALNIITNQEQKLQSISTQLQTISSIIQLLTLIIQILTPYIALNPAVKIIIDKAKAIIESLNTILAIIIPSFQQTVNSLTDLKSQLRDVTSKVDQAASTNIPNLNSITGITNFGTTNLNSIATGTNTSGTNFEPYKGFTFALKEENNPKFNIRGNKRHYAVAINRNNVEVVKSDFSFTQDPNDLIEQLKLIIDQQNLQS